MIGNSYVYPVLDWEDNAGEAVTTILMGTAILPCIYVSLWCVTAARNWIHRKMFLTTKWNTETGHVNNGLNI